MGGKMAASFNHSNLDAKWREKREKTWGNWTRKHQLVGRQSREGSDEADD